MNQIWTQSDAKRIVEAAQLIQRATIAQGGTDHPTEFQLVRFTLTAGTALDRAIAKAVSFPFKSLYVMASSHPSLQVKFLPNTLDSLQSAMTLSAGDSLSFSNPLAKGYVYWDSQSPGPTSLTVDILFSVTGDIKSGSLTSVRGGVKTDMYNSAINTNLTLVGAATAVPISDPVAFTQVPSYVANNIDRQVLIQNMTGADLFLGSLSTVTNAGATKGFTLSDGDSFRWNNKAILYGYSVAGGVVNLTIEY